MGLTIKLGKEDQELQLKTGWEDWEDCEDKGLRHGVAS